MCTVILGLGVLVGILFLEETHECRKHRRDRGIEIGRWLLNYFSNEAKPIGLTEYAKSYIEDQETLPDEDVLPGYRTTEGSPLQPSSRLQSPLVAPADLRLDRRTNKASKPKGVRKAFTKQVILNIVGFGLLA